MGAIAISEPIFTKIGVLASKLVSVGFAKIDAITAIWWSITRNRMKIYMGAISKSEPISIKFKTAISVLHLIPGTKYHGCGVHSRNVKIKSDERYIWEL